MRAGTISVIVLAEFVALSIFHGGCGCVNFRYTLFYKNVLNPISFEQVGSVERKGESLGKEVI